jgi:hypothetical protein
MLRAVSLAGQWNLVAIVGMILQGGFSFLKVALGLEGPAIFRSSLGCDPLLPRAAAGEFVAVDVMAGSLPFGATAKKK